MRFENPLVRRSKDKVKKFRSLRLRGRNPRELAPLAERGFQFSNKTGNAHNVTAAPLQQSGYFCGLLRWLHRPLGGRSGYPPTAATRLNMRNTLPRPPVATIKPITIGPPAMAIRSQAAARLLPRACGLAGIDEYATHP